MTLWSGGVQQALFIVGTLSIAFALYFALRILYGLWTFPDRSEALAELEKDLKRAKKFLRLKGVQV